MCLCVSLNLLFVNVSVTRSQRSEDPCAALIIQNASQTGRIQTSFKHNVGEAESELEFKLLIGAGGKHSG